MGKKKSKTSSSEVKQVESSRNEFFRTLAEWNKARLRSESLAKEVVNLRNETTYLTSDRVSKAVGVFLRPSNLYVDVTEKLHGTLSQLRTRLEVMIRCVEGMKSLLIKEKEWSRCSKPDSIIEGVEDVEGIDSTSNAD